jgi:hypothetical protein
MILRPWKKIKELEELIRSYEIDVEHYEHDKKFFEKRIEQLKEKIDSMTRQELYNPGVWCAGCKHHFTEINCFGTNHYCSKNCLCKGREE